MAQDSNKDAFEWKVKQSDHESADCKGIIPTPPFIKKYYGTQTARGKSVGKH
jgi:hypothetical protein